MYFDTHCHLDHPSLSVRISAVLSSARLAGVERFVVPGVAPEGWSDIAAIASREEGVFGAFGLHPMLAGRYDDHLLEKLERYAGSGVAIGEIGLDSEAVGVSREIQIAAFRGQLRLAARMGLPVLVHCRGAFRDALDILREERVRDVGGIMHGFSGSPETALQCIGMGLKISVAGSVTYRNAVKPLRLVEKISLEHLVLETDAPDMTPEPYRGRGNEPAFMPEIAHKVAAIKGICVEEVAAVTTANAERVLRVR
ncbi:MAG: TatD family hydrolase [Geobacteraceae bacterium]|nr:TatD family hydrolase [Geobacteraceae bacterium]